MRGVDLGGLKRLQPFQHQNLVFRLLVKDRIAAGIVQQADAGIVLRPGEAAVGVELPHLRLQVCFQIEQRLRGLVVIRVGQ